MIKPESTILNDIVPKELKKTFSLMEEKDTKFTFQTSPKKPEAEAPVDDEFGSEELDAPEEAEAPIDEPDETPEAGDDESETKWLIKKLVGTLKYAGAMATAIRGAMPSEAHEIVEKLITDLEEMDSALKPYAVFDDDEPDDEEAEGEEPTDDETLDDEEPEDEIKYEKYKDDGE